MPQINLKVNLEQPERTSRLARQLCVKRAAYIRKALDYFNEKTERELLAEQFKRASARCRRESLKVCREFELKDIAWILEKLILKSWGPQRQLLLGATPRL